MKNIPTYDDIYAASLRDVAHDMPYSNAAAACCDIHPQDRVALRWLAVDGAVQTWTFADFKAQSCRFANALTAQGIGAGDVVAVLLPRIPELIVALLGCMRVGAVYQPLFTAFGPKAVEDRVRASAARLIVTDEGSLAKLDALPDVERWLVTPENARRAGDFHDLLRQQEPSFDNIERSPKDSMLLLYTSGTTGKPKGVEVPTSALNGFRIYMQYGIGLRPDDVYWNVADAGWAYGLFYAAIGPLLLGQATIFYPGPFTSESLYRVIQTFGVTNLAASPTAYRLLMADGVAPAQVIRGQLRVASSAGEALNPEVVRWFTEHLSCPVNDHYGQTEGGMLLANHHGLRHPVALGTAGRALPGIRAAILDDSATERPAGVVGELAIDRARSPLFWFDGYWLGPDPPRAPIARYHRTGDLAQIDADGTVKFVGRADDVITSSGYRIGPFDVESTLMEHSAVAETAVIGKPDLIRTELVKAFVVLKPGMQASEALAEELKHLVKSRLAAHAYPRELEFVTDLPKTPSGKIQRFLLRQREVAASERQ